MLGLWSGACVQACGHSCAGGPPDASDTCLLYSETHTNTPVFARTPIDNHSPDLIAKWRTLNPEAGKLRLGGHMWPVELFDAVLVG